MDTSAHIMLSMLNEEQLSKYMLENTMQGSVNVKSSKRSPKVKFYTSPHNNEDYKKRLQLKLQQRKQKK